MTSLVEALNCLIDSLEALSATTQIELKTPETTYTQVNKSKLMVTVGDWQLLIIGSSVQLWHYQRSPYSDFRENLWVWRPHILDWQIVRELLEIAIEEGYQRKVERVMQSESFITAIAWQFDRSKDLTLTLSMPSLSMTVRRFHIWDKPKPEIKVIKLVKN